MLTRFIAQIEKKWHFKCCHLLTSDASVKERLRSEIIQTMEIHVLSILFISNSISEKKQKNLLISQENSSDKFPIFIHFSTVFSESKFSGTRIYMLVVLDEL